MPEASTVVVKVTHPCYVSVLRAKLHRSLDIPLEDIRYRKGGWISPAVLPRLRQGETLRCLALSKTSDWAKHGVTMTRESFYR